MREVFGDAICSVGIQGTVGHSSCHHLPPVCECPLYGTEIHTGFHYIMKVGEYIRTSCSSALWAIINALIRIYNFIAVTSIYTFIIKKMGKNMVHTSLNHYY